MQTAISYRRFSTDTQAKGDSLRRQLEAARTYCARNNLILDETLSFADLGLSAYSGRNLKQGKLGAFLEAVKEGKIAPGTVLIVESLDRLSRQSISDAQSLFTEILKSGVEIVTLQDGKRYNRESLNNLIDVIISLLTMARANEESLIKSQRIGEAKRNKRKKIMEKGGIYTARVPAWISIVDGKLVLNEKAKTVSRVFELYKSGLGCYAIAKRLDAEGVPTMKTAKRWSVGVLSALLFNPTVIGDYHFYTTVGGKRVPTGEVKEGYFPAAVDKETYYYCQHLRQRVSPTQGRVVNETQNLFRGVIKCQCGAVVHSVFKGPKPEHRYLLCSDIHCEKSDSFPSHIFEEGFLEIVFRREFDVFQPVESTATEALAALQAEMAANEAQIAKITDLIMDSDNPPKTLVAKLSDLEERNAAIQAEIKAVEVNDIAAPSMQTEDDEAFRLARVGNKLEGEEVRGKVMRAIRTHVDKITVCEGSATEKRIIPSPTGKAPYPANFKFCRFLVEFKNGQQLELKLEKRGREGHARTYPPYDPEEWEEGFELTQSAR